MLLDSFKCKYELMRGFLDNVHLAAPLVVVGDPLTVPGSGRPVVLIEGEPAGDWGHLADHLQGGG